MWQKRTQLQQAWQHFHAKRVGQAEQLAQKVIKDSPQAEAYYLLGLIASHQEDWLKARRQLQKAVELDPWFAPAQYSLGLLLHQLGLTTAAIPHYTKAVEISPEWAEAQTNLGNAYLDLGNLDQAIRCYQAALSSQPDAATTIYNLGTALHAKGQITEALACYEQALAFNPQDSDARNNLGSLYLEINRYAEAVAHFRQALAADPTHQYAAYNLARTLHSQTEYAEAQALYETLLQTHPTFLEARLHLGHTLLALGRYDFALETYQKCLSQDSMLAAAYNGRGTAYLEQGKLDLALKEFNQACQLSPQDADIRLNRGMTLLLQGDWQRGWADYEWRWQQAQATPRPFRQPRWDGQPLAGQTLLIYSEQGLGDWLQFSRYLPLLKSLVTSIVIEVPPPLLRLCQPLTEQFQVIAAGSELPAFDYQAPLLSLPFLLKLTEIPPPFTAFFLAYLDLQQHPVLLNAQNNLKVGLVWQSNTQSNTAQKRSSPLELLLPLAALPGTTWFSLQKEVSPAQQEQLDQAGIYDCSPYLSDFADTGAWLQRMDLLITVDTSVAHLAGSLNIPTGLMLPFVPDWRWQLTRTDSPWYASLQLLRQPQAKDWVSVIQLVKSLILKVAAARTQS